MWAHWEQFQSTQEHSKHNTISVTLSKNNRPHR